MSREKNIYYNLIKNENSFTESFVNILADENILNKFKKFLTSKFDSKSEKIDFRFEDIETQSFFEYRKYGRPDIIIQNKNLLLVIEVKINIHTELTENQKNGYSEYVSQKNIHNNCVVFIVPKQYSHIKKIFDIKSDIEKVEILYWEDLLAFIKDSSEEKYFKDFIKTAEGFMDYTIIHLEEDDMDNIKKGTGVVKSFSKILGIVHNTYKLMNSDNDYSCKWCDNEYSYGFFISDKNEEKYLLYIGILYDAWEEKGEPLYVGLGFSNDNTSNKDIIDKIEKRKENTGESEIKTGEENWEKDWTYYSISFENVFKKDSGNPDSAQQLQEYLKELI